MRLKLHLQFGMAAACALCFATATSQTISPAVRLDIPHSWNPIAPYRGSSVPLPNLANSPRLDTLIQDGVLKLSLQDAISLSLENNLDIAIARYNIPIAAADIQRTRAGGSFRGVNAGVVQNTPGGGVGGFGSGAAGAGAGGTSGGAGGAGSGASGIVQSTLGAGTNVSSFDPTITGTFSNEHATSPLSNTAIYGIPTLKQNATIADIGYQQAFQTGTSFSASFNNERDTTNSPSVFLNPALNTNIHLVMSQQLLAGFGLGPNTRFLRIAKNNQKISDQAFKLQVLTTVTQIANIYWDLVAAYDDEHVKEASLEFAQKTLESDQKQLALQAIPAMDVTKAEGEVATREQELTIAKTALQLQELLVKNALTKNLDDAALEAMPVVPTDKTTLEISEGSRTEDMIAQALKNRLELSESLVDLDNRTISRDAARNALLPALSLQAVYNGTGLGGVQNPASDIVSTSPSNFPGAMRNALNFSAPDYYVGLSLNVPLRNRVAKSDQYRSELETRQAELRLQQLKKQIRIEVRNAQYALQQSEARVSSARKARDLAAKMFDISQKEQGLGAGSNFQTLTAQRDLSVAVSALVAAETAYRKARVELDRAIGVTLEANGISVDDARTGVVQERAQAVR